MRRRPKLLHLAPLVALSAGAARAQTEFVNWETPHVHPLELTPDGKRLLAVNTADARLEVFELTDDGPQHSFSVPVGLDPVSVRALSNSRAWVVNHVSDSVSVVDLQARNVVATLHTEDEPADVVFASGGRRAFVSCSQANSVLVFDTANTQAAPTRIAIDGEDPRALAVSADGSKVYVAIFESGNRSTVLAGGALFNFDFPPGIVNSKASPYSGRNPPPNSLDEGGFSPPMRAGNPAPPPVGLIVKKNAAGEWRDDFLGDWTHLVSGASAAKSGRSVGWDLVDNDLAILDAKSGAVTYAHGLMNACMALAVHPASGEIAVIGTDGTNEQRFEPVLRGKFLRVELARVRPNGETAEVVDLNPHLDYSKDSIASQARRKSVGDPRGLAWNEDGSRGFLAGMGSNNVIVVDASGRRIGEPIEVGEGPTGVVFDAQRKRVYVLCKFAAVISVLEAEKQLEIARTPFFDPSPAAIRVGRKHLYDTHRNSGLGQLACASCHIDARLDHLAWDLGDPSGALADFAGNNLAANNALLLESDVPGRAEFKPFHPMKGPMTTQSLQAIIGLEPLHWRGDRSGLEAFAGAFVTLQGGEREPTPAELQEFEDFLATIAYPPNPYRNFDNTLPTDMPLPGHFATGRFGEAGKPLPNGNALRGLERFRTGRLDNHKVDCVTCHTLPTGAGPDALWVEDHYEPIAPGARGERHHMLVSQDGSSNVSMKSPQLRNLYEKVGCDFTRTRSHFGFGLLHDGSIDSIERFVNESAFSLESDQDTADMVAFLLCFSGSDLPRGAADNVREPPGGTSLDTHAFVGRQLTLAGPLSTERTAQLARMLELVERDAIGLIAKGRREGRSRGWVVARDGVVQSDRASETTTLAKLIETLAEGEELTFTATPKRCERRMGIDRDSDGALDGDELDAGSDPADPRSRPKPR
ncbi:MAG: beta-propeller fold lactonase family protein [Planctomycetes bacterium]|nr:beta-propeller fold lactonase family protein [Planctomycetota bacterium]